MAYILKRGSLTIMHKACIAPYHVIKVLFIVQRDPNRLRSHCPTHQSEPVTDSGNPAGTAGQKAPKGLTSRLLQYVEDLLH